MNNIPQSRLILYFLIAALLPVFFVIVNFTTKMNAIEELKKNLDTIHLQALIREKKQSLNMIVRKHYRNADHFYIDKHLENLSFLKPEAEALQTIVNNKYFAGDETVKKRLEHLKDQENKFLFSEGNVQAYPFFQETTASLVHPVEMNLNDLKKVLALIEGQPIGDNKSGPNKPQLIITDFKLDKKEITDKNDILLINMKLLKREYTP